MPGLRDVVDVTARDDRGSVVAVVYLLVARRKGIDVESERIQEIGKLFGLENVNTLAKTKFPSDLEEALNNFEGRETFSWVVKCCHQSSSAVGETADNRITESYKRLFP